MTKNNEEIRHYQGHITYNCGKHEEPVQGIEDIVGTFGNYIACYTCNRRGIYPNDYVYLRIGDELNCFCKACKGSYQPNIDWSGQTYSK